MDDPTCHSTDQLQRDLAVMQTLAHVGWLTTDQVHALCFPHTMRATVCRTLRQFAAAGWVQSARWRVAAQPCGHVWALTRSGYQLMSRYGVLPEPWGVYDLARPSTTIEKAEWRAHLAVRTLIVQLVVEARQTAALAAVAPSLALQPTPSLSLWSAEPCADAILTIAWSPAAVQPSRWLPWTGSAPVPGATTTYVVCMDREGRRLDAAWLQMVLHLDPTAIPIIILNSAERHVQAQQVVQQHGLVPPLRLAAYGALTSGMTGQQWVDGYGSPCSLRLHAHEVPSC